MRTLIIFISHPKVLLLAGSFAWLEIVFLPNPLLVFVLAGAMFIDLITGLLKSWDQGKITTSSGLRKTVTKVTVYSCMIIATWLLANLLKTMYAGFNYTWLVNWMISILSLIELYSIFENLYTMDPDSIVSKKVARPILKLLKGLIEKADQNLNSNLPKDATEDTAKN